MKKVIKFIHTTIKGEQPNNILNLLVFAFTLTLVL